MFDIDRWREIWASISSNKLRTFLSGFTISLALFVFIVLFGMGNGLQNGFEKEFFKAGAMNIYVFGTRTSEPFAGYQKGRQIVLENEDLNYIYDNYKESIKYISGEFDQSMQVKFAGESGNYFVKGVNADYFNMIDVELIEGRYFTEKELSQQNKTVVIGTMVAKDMLKGQEPIGQYLALGTGMYEIVGVFRNKADNDQENRMIYAPITTLQTIYGTQDLPTISITPKEGLSNEEISNLSKEVVSNLKSRHSVSQTDQSGIRAWDSTEQMGSTNQFFFMLTVIVIVIGGGSLIAGIVSIGNIMVFSVKERTKEIGIRKALGATPLNIIGLIMQEAISITLVFGALGILLATLLVENINDSLSSYFIYDPGVSISSLIFACLVLFVAGFLAGFIPARFAAKIKPIDALRNE
jgi:putative ABC transport system permease protein